MIEAMKQALEDVRFAREALAGGHLRSCDGHLKALAQSLTQAIEQSEKQEPVATLIEHLAFTDGIIRFYGVENMEQLPVGTEFYTTPQPQQAEKQEPVATLWQHGETGRTRITMPGDITDCDARWFKAADLYTTHQPQREWVSLTDAEIEEFDYYARDLVMDIEKALKERNT